jgi:hypothetical protein
LRWSILIHLRELATSREGEEVEAKKVKLLGTKKPQHNTKERFCKDVPPPASEPLSHDVLFGTQEKINLPALQAHFTSEGKLHKVIGIRNGFFFFPFLTRKFRRICFG